LGKESELIIFTDDGLPFSNKLKHVGYIHKRRTSPIWLTTSRSPMQKSRRQPFGQS
jgi:hypothetical protein